MSKGYLEIIAFEVAYKLIKKVETPLSFYLNILN
jgi:hypothetical protein